MNLNTGKLITRRILFEIPVTQIIIDRVEELARINGITENLTFKNRKGEFITDKNDNILLNKVFKE